MNGAERLEGILAELERLAELSRDHVILVEGRKDRRALEKLGISGDFFLVQSGGGPARAMERVEARGGRAVVLTDWDGRGDRLAEALAALFGAGNPDVDFSVREGLRRLCGCYVKDVESLDSLAARLAGEPEL